MVHRRARRHVRLGALLLTLGGVAFGLIQILQATIGAFNPRPVVTLMLAACVAVAGATLARWRRRTVDDRRSLELLRVWPLPRMGDLDALTLGVFPAGVSDLDGGAPTYVPRDIDSQLADALRDGGCVLIVGPARAGKSRTAFEATRRVLTDRTVVVPVDGAGLRGLADDGRNGFGADSVWWLDDLERFLDDLSGDELALLLDQGLTVVATLREEPWEALLRAGGMAGERGRRLRGAAAVFTLPMKLSDAETVRAVQRFGDLDFSKGLGERFAAAGDGRVGARILDAAPPPRRHDPLLALAGVATLLLAAALGVVIAVGGFSRATPPALGAQVDALRQHAAAAGEKVVFVRPEQLHGFDQTSYVILLRPTARGSDELRIYDVIDGWLRLRLDFQPRTRGERFDSRFRPWVGVAYTSGVSVTSEQTSVARANRGGDDFRLERLHVPDLFNDGERQLVADYTYTPALNVPGPELPIIVVWDDLAQRYELQPLLPRAQPQPAVRRWDSPQSAVYVLRDPTIGTALRDFPVDGYIVTPETADYPPTLVVGTNVSDSASGRLGLAVSQYSVLQSAGGISVTRSGSCATEVLRLPDTGPAIERMLRASIGLAPARLSFPPDPACGHY